MAMRGIRVLSRANQLSLSSLRQQSTNVSAAAAIEAAGICRSSHQPKKLFCWSQARSSQGAVSRNPEAVFDHACVHLQENPENKVGSTKKG